MIIKRRSFLASLPLAGAAVTVVSCGGGGGGGGRGLVPSVAPVSLAAVPSSFAWPDATNTGSSGSLTAYTGPMTITADGTVIDSQDITSGKLIIQANNVTIKNCRISVNDYYCLDGSASYGLVIKNCTLVGPGASGSGNTCILGGINTEVGYCDISQSQHGVIAGDSGNNIHNCYIHDLNTNTPSTSHFDEIIVDGGNTNTTIQDNTLIGRDTSHVLTKTDFGSIDQVYIKHNKMLNDPVNGSPGYVAYFYATGSHTVTNAYFTNNVVQKGGYGYYAVSGCTPTFTGNTDYDTGAPKNAY